ncbi:hypothetical protein IW152_004651 [Coemansia sp. BCRC 34962]|nr:hypothetical protein IW152_004651 [Coemansia sp. BCRC 34962]
MWSLYDQSSIFTWRYHQWCWAVRFVYPFYFGSESPMQVDSTCELAEAGRASSDGGRATDSVASYESTPSTEDDEEMLTDLPYLNAELSVAIEAVSAAEFVDDPAPEAEAARDIIDHSADMENGVEREPTSSSSDKSGDGDSGVSAVGSGMPSVLPSMMSPLLLCATERDVLLLDPANSATPVVSSIMRATSRSGLSIYTETPFDRISFLEWVPELGIVVAGSFSGTIALISLRQANGMQQTAKYTMQVLAHLPAEATNKQLYGVVVYRHTLDIEQSKAVTLLLTYIDGAILAYELRNSPDIMQACFDRI